MKAFSWLYCCLPLPALLPCLLLLCTYLASFACKLTTWSIHHHTRREVCAAHLGEADHTSSVGELKFLKLKLVDTECTEDMCCIFLAAAGVRQGGRKDAKLVFIWHPHVSHMAACELLRSHPECAVSQWGLELLSGFAIWART